LDFRLIWSRHSFQPGTHVAVELRVAINPAQVPHEWQKPTNLL
jgi:hypothetical protein